MRNDGGIGGGVHAEGDIDGGRYRIRLGRQETLVNGGDGIAVGTVGQVCVGLGSLGDVLSEDSAVAINHIGVG